MQAKKMTHGLKKLTSAIKFSHLAYAGLIAGQVISHNAQAAPEGGVVVGGDGSITAQDLTTIIDQKTDLLAIDWDSFNLTEEELVKFLQPNSSSIVLNRILDQNPSTIRGAIESNGHVILANPRGVLFTETATVNVGAITAAGLDMDSSGFMNGDFSFRGQDGSTGVVVNRGLINAASAVLVGKQVTNASSGLISADMVSLAAADEAVLTFDTDGMIGVKVTKEVMENQLGIDSAVLNEGAIEGAQVLMDAKVSGGLFTSAVNNKGTVLARGIDTSGGTIRLTGSGSAVVNSGTLDASGSNGGQVTLDGDSATHSGQIVARGSSGQGGQVKVLGDTVTVSGDIDARGRAAGGEVLVGGDYQGKNERVRNAETTVVTAEAEIDASGIGDGNGGRVIVWADDSTHFAGSIRAESGVLGGDGGFVETSGKVNLHLGEATMSVSTLSLAGGDTGTWLLDPGWLEIMADADCTENCVSVVALAAALNNNNVTITVSASETDPVNYSSTVDDASGNAAVNENNPDYSNGILVSSDLSWDSGNTLTLTSHNQVQIAANVTIDAVSGANAGHLAVNADGDFTNLGSVLVSDFSLDLGGSFVNSGIVSVENLNLNVGNTGADTFNTLGDITVSTSGTVVGGSGTDTVDTVDGITWTLGTVDGSASAAGIDFSNIEQVDTANAIVDGSSNGVTEAFDLTDGTLNVLGIDFTAAAEAKAGAETDDSVTSNATSWKLVGNKSVTAGAVTFSGIDSVTTNSATLNGTANADEFSVDGSGTITSYDIQFAGFTAVNAGANGDGKDTVDTIPDGLTWILGTVDGSASAAGIDFTGIEQVDTANAIVDGSSNGVTETFDLTDGTLNVLGIDFTAAAEAKAGAETDDSVTSNATSWTLVGNKSVTAGAVTFSGIDSVTTNSATLNGTANADEFSVDGSGNITSYEIQFSGLSVVNAGANGVGKDTVDTITDGLTWTLGTVDGSASAAGIDFTGIEQVDTANAIVDGINNDIAESFDLTDGILNVLGIDFTAASEAKAGAETDDSVTSNAASWTLEGNRSATAGAVTFSGIDSVTTNSATLNGTDNADEFSVDGSGNVTSYDIQFAGLSAINAGADSGGLDTVDASGADIQLNGADGEARVRNIDFTGIEEATNGNLVTSNNGDRFVVTGADSIKANEIAFAGITSIAAGTATTDTVDANGADVQLNGTDGEARIHNIDFTGIEEATNGNLVASNNGDRFVVTGTDSIKANEIAFAGITSVAAGTATTDTVDASGADVQLNGTDGEARIHNIEFTGIEEATNGNLVTSNNGDRFVVTGADSIKANEIAFAGISSVAAGTATTDTVDASGADVQLNGADGEARIHNIDFTGIEEATNGNLVASNNADRFVVTGTDSIKANEIAFAGITSVAAGTATTDEVTGLTGEDWSFDGSEGVVNNGITFTGVEFLIAQSAGLVGSDNGDTYTLESDGDVVVGDFTFQSLTHVNAGEGSDVLLGTSSADSFSLNSDGDVTSYGIVFSGLENVDAGDGDDELDASGKALHLTGNNYEVEDNDNNLTFSAIENVFVEVLYGTTGTDTFDVTGNNKLDANEIQFSGLQVVYSNGGNDFLFAKNTDSNSGKINKITFEGEFIKNVETVNLSDGVDTIEILSGGRIRVNDQEEFTTLFVNALGGDDTVIGYDSEDWTITASGDAQCIGITFTNVEMLVAVNAGLIAPENYDNFSLVASDVNPFAINIATANLTIEGANFVESSAGTGLLNANILGDTGVSLTANANEIDAGGLLFSGIDKVHAQSLTATDTATSFTAGGAAGSLTVSVPAGSDIDFFDLTRVTAGTGTDSLAAGAEVDLLSDAGEFFSNGINYFGIDSVDVASTHAVNGSGAAETFTLTANNAFDITLAGGREISFSNVSNVHAGGGYDTLDTSGNVILNGNTREARSAEIDFTGIDGTTNGVMVVSNNGDDFEVTGADTINANGIDFSGITSVTAGTGSDKATGLSGENWSLDALGNPQNNGIVFTNVEEFHAQNAGLDGSANADTFVLQGTGAVSYGGHSFKNLASVDGGGGDDTLDTSGSGLGVTLSGSDYQLSAGDIDFFNIEYAITAALTGSAGADTFTVTGAKTLDAWLIHFSGVDTVTAAGGDLLVTDAVALSGADNQVVAHEITVTGISDVTAASLEGTGGNDSFEIRGDKQLKANQINFAGVDSVDALGGSGDSVTGLSGSTWKLGTMENNNIAFTGVESVNTNRGILLGTAGVDTFTLEASGGVRVDTVTFSDLSLVNGVGGSDVLDASAFAAGLALSGSDNRLTAQGLDLTFANIFSATTATLAGTAGVDEFAVDALDSLRAGEIAFSGVSEINAGDGADLLRVAGDGRSFDVTGSRSLSLGPIDVSGLERLEYSGTGGTATGATGIDWSLEATPGEVENSLITFAGVQTLVADGAGLFGTAAAENYGLQDDSDVVIHGLIFQSLTGVDAGGGSDTITLASSAAATLTGTDGEAEIRGLNFSHIEAVANGTLAASGNGDRYVVTGANAVKANEIAFSGITSIAAGSGSDSVTGDGTDWTLTANNDELTNRGITFTGVERVAASGAGLYGPDTAEQYALSDSGIEVEGVTFTGLAFVDAGIAADQLDATGYMGQLALTGNSKQLDAGGLLIRNMDTIIADSLTGSSGADSFDVAADGSVAVADLLFTSGLGAIDAGDGDDSIAVASDITLAGQNGAVAAAGIDFTHIENASGTNIIVVGTAGDESFALQGSKKILTYGITIDGVAGVEALGGVNRIVGTAGADTFAVSGNNALTTAGIDFSGISAVSAGGGSDRLQGTAGADNFELAASGDIGVAGINFRGLETVAAGAGSDSVTANGASWTSLGSGGALVDGSALATVNSVTVVFEDLEQVDNAGAYQGQDIDSEYAINSLDSLTVAGVTFAGLNSFTAGSGFDVLRGADIDAQWSLSASQGTISSGDESLLFSGVESIVAGSGSDHFTLAGGTFTAIDTGAGNDTVLFAGTALDSLSLGDGNDLLQVDVDSSQDVLVYGGGGDDEFQFNVAGETWQIFDSASRVGNFQFSGFEWLDNNTGSLTLETDLGFDFVNGGDNSASFNRNGAGILFADGVRLGYDGSGDIAITSSSTETIGGDLQADRANLTVAGNVDITSDVQVLNIQTAGADIDISVVAQGDLVIDEINAGGGTITLNSAKFGSLTAETYGDTHLTAGKVTLGTELQQWSVIGSAINPLRMDVSNSVDIVSISYFEPDFVGQVPTLTAKGDELQSVAGAQAAQGLKSAVQNAVEDFAQVDPGIFSAVNPYSTGVDAVNSPEMQLTGDQLLPLTVSGAPEEDELPRRSAELEGEDGDLQHQSPREGDQAALATEEVGG